MKIFISFLVVYATFIESFKAPSYRHAYKNSKISRCKLSESNSLEGFDVSNVVNKVLELKSSLKSGLTFPATDFQLNEISTYLSSTATEWGLFSKTFSGPEWLEWFDIARLPIDSQYQHILADLPVWIRLSVGLTSLEVLPLAIDLLILNAVLTRFSKLPENADISGLPKSYDKDLISSFYAKFPGLVIGRTFEILNLSKDFLLNLLNDYSNNSFEQNSPQRAKEIRELISTLGPTAIKIGQAISVRPDLLSPPYIAELSKLQDKVPPFDSKLAVEIIEKSYNEKIENLFEDTTNAFREPVAAASLGQVYKAILKSTGEYVAVKVQRPNMKIAVTLDLYIIRSLLEFGSQYNIANLKEECEAFIMVIDNWAGRFVDELDYELEVQNANLFRSQMVDSTTSLGDVIVVPKMYSEYCTESVLVSEWIDGTKLNKIDIKTKEGKDIVKKLTQVLLNCYLVQLLETGFLHADPHPGNFLVTNQGKLCILDYGLMTSIDEDKRYGLIEYISHLLAKDYDATLEDLIILGFIPSDVSENEEKRKIVAPLLAQVLNQLSEGGGAKKLNIDDVGRQIENLSEQYPIIIPAYFGLIVRAFGSLEGLGLSVDENYSITKSCFPYLSKRLLSDDSARIRKSLRVFLYGNENSQKLNMKRLDQLADGYKAFSVVSADAASGKTFEVLKFNTGTRSNNNNNNQNNNNNMKNTEMTEVDPVLSSVVKILFSEQGNYVQELLMDEAVRITDALTRSLISTALSASTALLPSNLLNTLSSSSSSSTTTAAARSMTSSTSSGSSALNNPMNPIKRIQNIRNSILNPLTTFQTINTRLESIFQPSTEDIDSLKTLKRLLQILAGIPIQKPIEKIKYINDNIESTSGLAASISQVEEYDEDDDNNERQPPMKVQLVDGNISLVKASGTTTATTTTTTTSAHNDNSNAEIQMSKGKIDMDDITLIRQVITKIAASILNTPLSRTNIDDAMNNSVNGNNTNQIQRLNIIRMQLQSVLPLLQESTPGARKLTSLFIRKLASRSLNRIADTLERPTSSTSTTSSSSSSMNNNRE